MSNSIRVLMAKHKDGVDPDESYARKALPLAETRKFYRWLVQHPVTDGRSPIIEWMDADQVTLGDARRIDEDQ